MFSDIIFFSISKSLGIKIDLYYLANYSSDISKIIMNNIVEIIQQKPANICDISKINYRCAWDNTMSISVKNHKCVQKIKMCKKCGNFMCSDHITIDLSKCIACEYSDNIIRRVSIDDFMCKKCGDLIKSGRKRYNNCLFGYLCSDCSKKKYSHKETCFQL